MNKAEYAVLQGVDSTPETISVRDLTSHWGRTLLWGWTTTRNDFHVYIRERKLHIYCYGMNGEKLYYASGTELPLEGIVPDKRLRPECCDYEFCRRLRERGVNLPFTTWAESMPLKDYYGEIYTREKK